MLYEPGILEGLLLKVKIFPKPYENQISFSYVILFAFTVTEKLKELLMSCLFHPLDYKLPEDQDFIVVPLPCYGHISENFIWHFLIKFSRMNKNRDSCTKMNKS